MGRRRARELRRHLLFPNLRAGRESERHLLDETFLTARGGLVALPGTLCTRYSAQLAPLHEKLAAVTTQARDRDPVAASLHVGMTLRKKGNAGNAGSRVPQEFHRM